MLKPFKNLWPKYNSIDEFTTDYEYTSTVSVEGIPVLIGFMNEHCVDSTTDKIHVETCKRLADEARETFKI